MKNDVNNDENISELIVNDRCITEQADMKDAIKIFWENIGGIDDEHDVPLPKMNFVKKNMVGLDSEISETEISSYLKKLKNSKAAGLDDIPNEFYKNGGEVMIQNIYMLFRKIWEKEEVPTEWNACRVRLVHKGGHKSKKEIKNYRPIALNDTISKVFCGIINERLQQLVELEGAISEAQNGFRRKRRGEDNIYVVSQLIENWIRTGSKGYLAFLDVEKAYDKVNREILCEALQNVGVGKKIVNLIRSMYTKN